MKIGIDLGGSTVRILFLNGKSETYSKFSYPGNPLVNNELFSFLGERIGNSNVDIISCAVSGGGSEKVRKNLEDKLKKFSKHAFVFPDTEAVYFSFFKNGDGIVVISGTGSVSYGKRGNTVRQIGGLGYLLGDEGGGFWFGKEFMKRALLDMQKGKTTHYSKYVEKYFGTADFENILRKIYTSPFPSKVIADFGGAVLDTSVASEILGIGAKKLAKNVSTLVKILDIEKPEIALHGGVFAHSAFFRERFKEDVSKFLVSCVFKENGMSVEKAVIEMAEEEIEKRSHK